MAAQVMAEPAIRAQTLTHREIKLADDARLLLICGGRWAAVCRHGFPDHYSVFLGLSSQREIILHLTLHKGSNGSAKIVAVEGEGSIDLLVRLGLSEDRSQHVVRGHVGLLLRGDELRGADIQPAGATDRRCHTNRIVAHEPVYIVRLVVAKHLLRRRFVVRKLVRAQARTVW